MVSRWKLWMVSLLASSMAACPGDPPEDPGSDDGSTGILTTLTASSTIGDSETGIATDMTADDTTTDDPVGGTEGGTVDCPSEMQTLECGDGIDNDGDGAIDLFDAECVGPCDDDEGSFQTGLPGDNMDCNQDCFFDGNSGHGDDGCEWSLTCDPENPGAGLMPVSCDYNPGPQCDGMQPEPSQECIDFCTPYVPPGCDCFGCCEVQTADGPVYIFLNSEPPCSLDNLDACNNCTPQIDQCGTPCVPEDCQICFGETEPPEDCGGENTCPTNEPCEVTEDCPDTFFCYLGCCYPPQPG